MKNTKINILLSKCDSTAPIADDLAAWLDSPSGGNEIITYCEEMPLSSDDEYRAALKKIEGLFDAIPNTFDLMIIIINMAYYLFGRRGSQVNGSLTHLASRHGVRDDHHCRYRTHVLSAGLPVFLLL